MGGNIASCILTLSLHEGEWSASCPSCFNPWERAPGTRWMGGWVSQRASGCGGEWKNIPVWHYIYYEILTTLL